MWVLTEKGKNKFLGTVCFWNIVSEESKAETGYTLVSELHGLGLMQEALSEAIEFGFQVMKLKTIVAYTHRHNERSIRLLQRNGFRQEALPRKEVGEDRICWVLDAFSA